MAQKSPSQPDAGAPFDRFRDLTGKLLKVPKKEVDKKEAAYQRRKAKKRRGA